MTPLHLPTLENLMPSSLDDIIRKNRDEARFYESTEAELAALHGVVPIMAVTGRLINWRFITFLFVETNTPMVNLVGYNVDAQSSWMTSLVVAIQGTFVQTKSGSLYQLEGEPSSDLDLPYICATLNLWKVGPHFGVPAIFF